MKTRRTGHITLPIEQGFTTHPKVLDLAAALDIPDAHAAGIVVTLWDWASRFEPDGVVDSIFTHANAFKKVFGLEPDVVRDAMVKVGLLDETDKNLVVHDWMVHGIGSYLVNAAEARRQDRQRKRRTQRGEP